MKSSFFLVSKTILLLSLNCGKGDGGRTGGTAFNARQEDGTFHTYGTLSHDVGWDCDGSGGGCRPKRSVDGGQSHSDITLHITTEKEVFSGVSELRVRLRRSVPLLSPDYKLVVRDKEGEKSVNRTVAYPTCLYTGELEGDGTKVAVSTCQENRLTGVINFPGRNLVIEEVVQEHGAKSSSDRFKRSSDEKSLIIIYESVAGGGECGIKPWNAKKMKSPRRKAVRLKDLKNKRKTNKSGGHTVDFDEMAEEMDAEDESKSEDLSSVPEWESGTGRRSERLTHFNEGAFKGHVRRKRTATDGGDRAIEIAVFVDDVVYENERGSTRSNTDEDPIAAIQDIVFTYLNSVQLLYNSEKLTTQFRLILVRLEIFSTEIRGLDKNGGDIEGYLDSFCSWQSDENPSVKMADRDEPSHWDHALLLTGLNLYDRIKSQDAVIGLAWVSGMCHPSYSCTINEGNNYESVFVIAHEMGHNLGMNHDGERNEGNNCDPDRFLMSPALGPGKVTWSSCSNREIEEFLAGREDPLGLGTTIDQAKCLNDLPTLMAKYDYLANSKAPGEKVSAKKQCQKAFGSTFTPHVKKEEPFEDLCRELWCANSTHALRAHPALEATDCSAEPYPYGSICVVGKCVRYDPDEPIVTYYGTLNREKIVKTAGDDSEVTKAATPDESATTGAFKEDRPEWYDPIFTRVFATLKEKIAEQYQTTENGMTRVLPLKEEETEVDLDVAGAKGGSSEADVFYTARKLVEESESYISDNVARELDAKPKWIPLLDKCAVECGGSWTNVTFGCQERGRRLELSHCDAALRPKMSKTFCNVQPCS